VAELSIKSFPEDLLKRLKVQAALEGITLRNLVTQMLEAQYNRRKPAK
jgi:plasmid stability protein